MCEREREREKERDKIDRECVCVCVCVCERERGGERIRCVGKGGGGELRRCPELTFDQWRIPRPGKAIAGGLGPRDQLIGQSIPQASDPMILFEEGNHWD